MTDAYLLRSLERIHRMLLNRDRGVPPDRWLGIVAHEVDDLIDAAQHPRPEGLTTVAEALEQLGAMRARRRGREERREAI